VGKNEVSDKKKNKEKVEIEKWHNIQRVGAKLKAYT